MKFSYNLFIVCLLVATALSKTAEEWKSRSVYQIITDRFARTDSDTTACSNLNDYCGGTFKGIQNNLDYIQGMGFDAIWISPVVSNTPHGYHGYWVDNIYKINDKFGTVEELKELIRACHEKDIWVMVDIVANHVGYVDDIKDFSAIYPFNEVAHYNTYVACEKVDPKNETAFEACWLSGLPDLDQNHPFVRKTMLEWIEAFVKDYDFDALRIDTVPHVSRGFWKEFGRRSGVYTLGEILDMNLQKIASYQGPLDAVLNYALYSSLRDSFQNDKSMNGIKDYYAEAQTAWKDMTVLGNFINNHDNPRFLSSSTNQEAFKAALAFTICSIGIPMVYYGDEQAFNGGQDPQNRETLWTNMKTDSEIYKYLGALNKIRKNSRFYELEQIERFVDDSMYAFSRGDYFFAFTNSQDAQTRTITNHPYSEGTKLCNILTQDDCVEVKNGEFTINLVNGEVKIFAPSGSQDQPIAENVNSVKDTIAAFTNLPVFNDIVSF